MTRVLLVSGSRSLARIEGAEAWARALIRAAMEGVDLLIVGDADGPDRWAMWQGIRSSDADAQVYLCRGRDAGYIVAPDDDDDGTLVGRWASGKDTHPLKRNAAMVHDAAKMREHGADVRCLALLDDTKRDAPGKRATRGTEHTAGLAERAGITVRREVWR